MPLLATSPAIDAGSNAKALDSTATTLVYDQRGLSRFVDDSATTNVEAPTPSLTSGEYGYSKPLAIQYTSRPIAWSTHTVANRTQYEVQTSVNGIDNWQFFTYLSKDDMQLIPSDDGRYYYRVRAITTNGAPTEWSNPAAELNAYNLYLSASTNVPGAQPQVTISWPDEYGLRTYANSISYTIYRKSTGQASWGSQLATVTGMNGANIRTSYTDSTVSAGQIYEYRVDRTGMGGSAVQKGYIAAGVNAADSLQENRGTVLLVVDDRFVNSLEFEIAQLKQDLIGDGWKVQILSDTFTVPTSMTPM